MSHHGKEGTCAPIIADMLLLHDGPIESGREKYGGSVEIRRGYTHDGNGTLAHQGRAPHHAAIVLKMSVPKRVAEDDTGRAVGTVFVGSVVDASEVGLNAQGIEVVSAGVEDPFAGGIF